MGEEPGLIDQWLHSDDTGHFGEYLIDYALNSLPGYSQKLCNIYIPYKGRTSEIDVVMLHETGIYVFESKNYSGWIFGDENGQYWTQCLNPKTKNRFYNPILQNKTHIKALTEYLHLSEPLSPISYVVFSQRCEFKKVCERSKNTIVVKRPDMLKALRKEIKNRPSIITKEQIDQIYETLLPLVDISTEEKEKHIENIQKYKEIKETTIPIPEKISKQNMSILCPKCGAPMVLRTATKGDNKGKQFYGCSNFPKCREIINIAK